MVDEPSNASRFWAVPVPRFCVKAIVLIPHLIVVAMLGWIVALVQMVLWIPVLFGGKYPGWGRLLVTGYLQWTIRLSTYFFGLTDHYPPFAM